MVKGYETLVDSDTEVDVNTGMIAAVRLQVLTESRAGGTRIADLRVQMGRIIDAIHSTVPEELWPEILRKIDGPVALTHRRMSMKAVTTRKICTTPGNLRRQTRTAGLRPCEETHQWKGAAPPLGPLRPRLPRCRNLHLRR
jgi:hypothetical protein